MNDATKAIKFIEGLKVPTGRAGIVGQPVKLAPFQKKFIRGALAKGIDIAALSVGRGNGKSTLSAGLSLCELFGVFSDQPAREVLLAAKNRDQAAIVFQYAYLLSQSLPDDIQKRLVIRRTPKLELEFDKEHIIRAVAADGRGVLGTSPTLAVLDERGHWPLDQGNDLENALITGAGKRGGRTLLISTSASNDAHPFSKWLDDDEPSVYRQEHRPPPNLPADDRESLLIANPGCKYGIGFSLDRLERDAKRAIQRGGASLNGFRLYNRNERVSDENRDSLLTVDQWLACETSDLPPREGECIVGIDLGGSASMSAAAYYWPATGRLEARGWFPSNPGLLDRGNADGVSGRYEEMRTAGELTTLGNKTVPVAPWIAEVFALVEGENVAALVCDRFKQAEIAEALEKIHCRVPVIWRGFGYKDGHPDVDGLRRAVLDGKVKSAPSLLLRSAFADAVVVIDPAGNTKLAKGRSLGRIDPAAAATIAIAEGERRAARAPKKAGRVAWV